MQKRKGFFTTFLILTVISVFLIILSGLGYLNGFTGFLENLTVPVQRTTFGFLHSKRNDTEEISKLKEENGKLLSQIIDQKELQKENNALRDQFQETSIPSRKLLLATIVGSFDNQIMIDKGTNENLKTGDIVIVKNNLIGKISKVSEHTSAVDLINGEKISITAKTFQSEAIGIVKGQGGNIVIENVVLSDKLKKDDIVVTKGDVDSSGNGFPPGLVIGKIATVNRKASNLFQSAEIESFLNFDKLEKVFVIVK